MGSFIDFQFTYAPRLDRFLGAVGIGLLILIYWLTSTQLTELDRPNYIVSWVSQIRPVIGMIWILSSVIYKTCLVRGHNIAIIGKSSVLISVVYIASGILVSDVYVTSDVTSDMSMFYLTVILISFLCFVGIDVFAMRKDWTHLLSVSKKH